MTPGRTCAISSYNIHTKCCVLFVLQKGKRVANPPHVFFHNLWRTHHQLRFGCRLGQSTQSEVSRSCSLARGPYSIPEKMSDECELVEETRLPAGFEDSRIHMLFLDVSLRNAEQSIHRMPDLSRRQHDLPGLQCVVLWCSFVVAVFGCVHLLWELYSSKFRCLV